MNVSSILKKVSHLPDTTPVYTSSFTNEFTQSSKFNRQMATGVYFGDDTKLMCGSNDGLTSVFLRDLRKEEVTSLFIDVDEGYSFMPAVDVLIKDYGIILLTNSL